uniref:BCAR3 adaptor protein, NSP family member n=1 Tax=Fundulus heteroclitus TaxID=8078 RepID=A0A3Q2P8M9_FUNHE
MMAEGRFASLPRSLHPGSLSEIPSAAYQQVSLHGTLPRHRRGGTNVGQSSHTWDPKPNQAPPLNKRVCQLTQTEKLTPLFLFSPQFSRDQFILDCSLEKLRRELEEELKMNCEEPRSHAWYHGAIPRQQIKLQVWKNFNHFLIFICLMYFVVILNEAYSRVEYRLDKEGFDSVPALVRYYVGNRKPVSQVVGAIIFQPINRAFPLRYLEEKYGLSSSHKEAGLMVSERRGQNRLSLNIANGHDGSHNVHDGQQSQDNGFARGSQLRSVLQEHGDEFVSSQAIRGSDSQLCPKPPPKPSKVALARLPRSPCPPVPPLKPHKFRHFPPADSGSAASPVDVVPSPDSEAAPGRTERLQPSPADRRSCSPQGPDWERGKSQKAAVCGYVERLTGDGGDEAEGQKALDRSSYHHAIAALESTSEEEEEGEEGDIRRREKARGGFLQPVMETESTFRPSEFESRLLPPENKPLEMVVLKRAKELLLSHNHQSLARHLLMADCQVARILGVTPQLKGRMGVSSGLELVTLPHGRQLRLDLMERHHTMAIGVAVDILGCTGTVEERASTLNRIILVAMELKDAVGDLFAFAALMKALDMQQISRLEETWTTLRRNHTQTAISYEKILKPFYKSLYEGEAVPLTSSPSVVCVPLLLPLLTLMERPSTKPEGVELWEISDQGCDIMLRHLEAARDVAHNARNYTSNAEQVLEGFQCDEDLLEVFKTDFQLRLLWGSRGAAVNQSDRYNKFNLILTALSRKLEPTTKTQAVI